MARYLAWASGSRLHTLSREVWLQGVATLFLESLWGSNVSRQVESKCPRFKDVGFGHRKRRRVSKSAGTAVPVGGEGGSGLGRDWPPRVVNVPLVETTSSTLNNVPS